MMKTFYRLTKNSIFAGEFENCDEAFTRAEKLEGEGGLLWTDNCDGDDYSFFAFGKVVNELRTEYEITSFKKRA